MEFKNDFQFQQISYFQLNQIEWKLVISSKKSYTRIVRWLQQMLSSGRNLKGINPH